MYFIRQLLQGQWARTQQNLQNKCMVKTDQIARIRRLMSTSFVMYFKIIIIMSSSSCCNSLIYVKGKHTSPTSWMRSFICVFNESILLYGFCCTLAKTKYSTLKAERLINTDFQTSKEKHKT